MSNVVQNGITAVNRLFTEVFAAGKLQAADEILSRDFRFQYAFPGFSPGIEGIAEFTKTFHRAFPGFEVDVHELFGAVVNASPDPAPEDVRITIRWTFRGTHKGDFLGVKQTMKYATFSAIGVYRPSGGGKLSAGWLEMDTLGLLQHLQVVRPISNLLPGLRNK
jgi:predicted ester cyclase